MSSSSTDLLRTLFADDLDVPSARVFADDGIDLIELIPETRPAPAPPAPCEPDPALLEQARADGFAAGLSQADARLAEARAEATRTLTLALETAIGAAAARMATARERDATRIAATLTAVLGAVLPAAAAADAERSFACVLAAVAPMLGERATLCIRVHPDHADALGRAIAQLPAVRATLEVQTDPRVALGDCRVEWTDGGACLDVRACWRAVTTALAAEGLRLPILRDIDPVWDPILPEDDHGTA